MMNDFFVPGIPSEEFLYRSNYYQPQTCSLEKCKNQFLKHIYSQNCVNIPHIFIKIDVKNYEFEEGIEKGKRKHL